MRLKRPTAEQRLLRRPQRLFAQRRSVRGQGIAEYALILALVAVVVIAIIGLVGLATQRSFGLVVGSLGSSKEQTGDQQIRIEQAMCASVDASNQTGMVVTGFTNVPLNELRVYTTKSSVNAFDADSDGALETLPLVLNDGVSGTFKWNPMIKNDVANTGLCPVAIMITTEKGELSAIAPVKIKKF